MFKYAIYLKKRPIFYEKNNIFSSWKTCGNRSFKKPKKKKGHGRKKSEDYTAAKDIECKRDGLAHGAACPDDECEGSVYRQSDPGNIIRITGGSLVSATRYKLERYRCNLCNTVFFSFPS